MFPNIESLFFFVEEVSEAAMAVTAGALATVTEGVGDGDGEFKLTTTLPLPDLIRLFFFTADDSKSTHLVIFVKIKLLYKMSIL